MVKTTLKAVASRFASKDAEVTPTRRLLMIIRFVDGDWVLQKAQDDHKPRHRYTTEAKTLFQSLFPPKEETFCAKSRADKALHEVLGFRRPDDIETGAHFERDGIEWHPIILHLDRYCLNSKYLIKHANLDGRTLTPIAEHEHGEKLLKRFPRS